MSFALMVLILLMAIPIFAALVFSVALFRRSRRRRRSPLTGNLLRGPGESLRREIEQLTERLDDILIVLFATCLLPLLLIFCLAQLQANKVPIWQMGLAYALFLGSVIMVTVRIYHLLSERSNLYLGLDAETAVGQELNQLMLNGCRIYHDFPAESFNIDHVVVGPGGVYAVETKGRAKPNKGRGSVDATVVYDAQVLRFPDWREKEPLEQAKRQADWLQKWLGSAVGESVPVKPALALPGWFIERTKPGGIIVFNGKSPQFLAKPLDTSPELGLPLIQRIAHQLEQRCRDVEPVAYRKGKN